MTVTKPADLETLSSYLTQISGTTLTYDSIRYISREAYRCYVPKIQRLDSRFFALAISSDVLPYLSSLTRANGSMYENVFIPAKDYKNFTRSSNEVGAIHEFRFFLADKTCSSNLVKFMTSFDQQYRIHCNDSLTFSINLQEASIDSHPST